MPLAEGYDGAVPVLPVADTLKRVRDGVVAETVDREGLVAAQTPQAFLARDAAARVRRRPRGRDRLRVARRAGGWTGRRRRRRPAAAQGDDAGRPRARRVVALKAVVFDVGETLVDEERWWRQLADREGLQPHVVWAALGVTIARGEEHDALWGHLGIEQPPRWWTEIAYSLDDLYPDAARLPAPRPRARAAGRDRRQPDRGARGVGPRVGSFPPTSISSSASLGVRKPDPAFFETVVELMESRADEVAYVGDRVDNDVLPAARAGLVAIHVRRGPVGPAAANAAGGGARSRRPCLAARRVSLAR